MNTDEQNTKLIADVKAQKEKFKKNIHVFFELADFAVGKTAIHAIPGVSLPRRLKRRTDK